MGRSRHGAQLPVEQPSLRHRGFDSLPTHVRASRLTGRAPDSSPGQDWVRAPGRAHAVVAQLVRAPARHAGGCGFESRRRRTCRRGRMEKVPVYETGGCRFDPCRRHQSTRRSSAEQSAAFRTRRSHVRIVPARRKVARKRSGQMRSLSRKQVGVARLLWVRVPPLPHARRDGRTVKTPGPQPGGRGSTPRRGTDAR